MDPSPLIDIEAIPAVDLPLELWQGVASFCGQSTLVALSRINRTWNTAIESALYSSMRLKFDPVPLHPKDEATLRVLWHLAQTPRRATMVRSLELSIVLQKRVQSFCNDCKSFGTGRCVSLRQSLPSKVLGSTVPSDDTLFALAGHNFFKCQSGQHENVTLLWAHLCLALQTCSQLEAVVLPVTWNERDLILCERAVRILAGHGASSNNTNLRCLQLPWSYLDSVTNTPTVFSTSPACKRLLTRFARMPDSPGPNISRMLVLASPVGAHQLRTWLSQRRISFVASLQSFGHRQLTVDPAYFPTPDGLQQYLHDVRVYIPSSRPFNTLTIVLHHTQLANPSELLTAIAGAVAPRISDIIKLRLLVMSLEHNAEVGWPSSRETNTFRGSHEAAAKALAEALQPFWPLDGLTLRDLSAGPVDQRLHTPYVSPPDEHLPFGQLQLREALEERWGALDEDFNVAFEEDWPMRLAAA